MNATQPSPTAAALFEKHFADFNKVAEEFHRELQDPRLLKQVRLLEDIVDEFEGRQLRVRSSFAREWEYSRILEAVKVAYPEPKGVRLVDFGGGNSPLCYLLARHGFNVDVLEVDSTAVSDLMRNARELGLDQRLQAMTYDGISWPLSDNSANAVLAVSVFEGLMRSRRPAFWSELRRVLKPEGISLVTFDYGDQGRFVGDCPTTVEEVISQLVVASRMQLLGSPVNDPCYGPNGPPNLLIVTEPRGYDTRLVQYSFASIALLNDPESNTDISPAPVTDFTKTDFSDHSLQHLLEQVGPALQAYPHLQLCGSPLIGRIVVRGSDVIWLVDLDKGCAATLTSDEAEPQFVLSAKTTEMTDLISGRQDIWALHYGGGLQLRGDVSLAMQFVDAMQMWFLRQ